MTHPICNPSRFSLASRSTPVAYVAVREQSWSVLKGSSQNSAHPVAVLHVDRHVFHRHCQGCNHIQKSTTGEEEVKTPRYLVPTHTRCVAASSISDRPRVFAAATELLHSQTSKLSSLVGRQDKKITHPTQNIRAYTLTNAMACPCHSVSRESCEVLFVWGGAAAEHAYERSTGGDSALSTRLFSRPPVHISFFLSFFGGLSPVYFCCHISLVQGERGLAALLSQPLQRQLSALLADIGRRIQEA